ncbi:hypothetical protein T11_18331 [Trichinella zimbabwensis]|uniref:Uncharacterized protein n=1 Tax=Trichinella zimbabwensis TaxID=268475 RepID=A0A0V1G6G3_9BILA|nr:hypothetical protein T11_18331 [Trichinella zimbabwensis]
MPHRNLIGYKFHWFTSCNAFYLSNFGFSLIVRY